MARIKRSTSDLIKMGEEHLLYETKMIESLARLIKNESVQQNKALRSAVIESLGIHFRVLLEFFFDKSPQATSVVAVDYYKEDSDWIEIRKHTVSVAQLKEAWKFCERVNKEVVHLTWNRLEVKPQDRAWLNDWERSYGILGTAFQQFLKTVPDDVIGDKIREQRDRPRDG